MSKPTAQQIIEDHSTIIVTALEDYREWWSGDAGDAEVVAQIDEAIDAINGFDGTAPSYLSLAHDHAILAPPSSNAKVSAEDSTLVATPPFYTHPDSNAFISWD